MGKPVRKLLHRLLRRLFPRPPILVVRRSDTCHWSKDDAPVAKSFFECSTWNKIKSFQDDKIANMLIADADAKRAIGWAEAYADLVRFKGDPKREVEIPLDREGTSVQVLEDANDFEDSTI